jgi:hypothetical protein
VIGEEAAIVREINPQTVWIPVVVHRLSAQTERPGKPLQLLSRTGFAPQRITCARPDLDRVRRPPEFGRRAHEGPATV